MFVWCRVCSAVFVGQRMLCFEGETFYTAAKNVCLLKLFLVPCLFDAFFVCRCTVWGCAGLIRSVCSDVFVGQRMLCFEGEGDLILLQNCLPACISHLKTILVKRTTGKKKYW